jgi:hypothetical protein
LGTRAIAIRFEAGRSIPLQEHDLIYPRPVGTGAEALVLCKEVDPSQFRIFARERELDRDRAALARSENVRRFGDVTFIGWRGRYE